MPARRVVPDKTTMRRLLEAGMTHKEIAEWVYEQTGEPVARVSVTRAVERYGLQGEITRYDDLIPWRVRTEHAHDYAARMLRMEARRRRGKKLAPEWEAKLDSWLQQLEEKHAVVTYVPDSPNGFYYVPREEGDEDIIRKPEAEEATA
jgi:DNA-binding transcriptional MerR regulator